MTEDLQGLLNRIQNDGLNKAEAERAKIVADAKAEAEKIVADAKAEAEKIVKNAEETAAASTERANVTIRQAARDIEIELKANLLARLNNIVKGACAQALDAALMAELIRIVAGQNEKDAAAGIEAVTADEKFAAALKNALTADLQANTSIIAGKNISAGLKVGFKGSDAVFDCTDDAFADIICEFVGPKLTAILKG